MTARYPVQPIIGLYPQSNGQTERPNQQLEPGLWLLCGH